MKSGLLTHICILGLLVLAGTAAFLMAYLAEDSPGGLFNRYAFVKVAWVFIGIYALGSSIIVLSAAVVLLLWKRRLGVLTVILCHAVPVLIVIIGVQLGVHDAIQDMLTDPPPALQKRSNAKDRPRTPPPSPRVPVRILQPGGSEIESNTQKERGQSP